MRKSFLLLLSTFGLLISASHPASAQALSEVSSCSGVYEFYGAPQSRSGVSVLYYISSTKGASLACFKGSRMGGATPLHEYLGSPDISNEDKETMNSAAKKLAFSDPFIHSLGI